MSRTVLSGLATCAPIAEGSPKPIVPSDPDVTIERGSVHRMNWHAIIWWFPTPVLTTSFSCTGLSPWYSASITLCVLSLPSGAGVYEKGYDSFSWPHRWSQPSRSACGAPLTSGSRIFSASLQSPATATVGSITRPNCDGSMSKWTNPPRPSSAARRASGAYLFRIPVVRSSNREPIATIRSLSWIAKLAYAAPCIPSMCIECGWVSSKTPIACSVVVTGTFAASASSASSSRACGRGRGDQRAGGRRRAAGGGRTSFAPWPT